MAFTQCSISNTAVLSGVLSVICASLLKFGVRFFRMFCLLVDEWKQAMCSMAYTTNRSIWHYLFCFFLIFVFVYHVKHNPYMNKHDIVNSRIWSIDFNRTKVNIANSNRRMYIQYSIIQLHTYIVDHTNCSRM